MKTDLHLNVTGLNYFREPRLSTCQNTDCKHNMAGKMGPNGGDLQCHFRIIEIGLDGICNQFELIAGKQGGMATRSTGE